MQISPPLGAVVSLDISTTKDPTLNEDFVIASDIKLYQEVLGIHQDKKLGKQR